MGTNGLSCPVCGGTSHSIHTSRGLFQCTRCRRQTSPTAETIFALRRNCRGVHYFGIA
ncbi:transposase [Acidiphilium acidophilum]|uniref:transposase n=1 Tax=Acidiphilium acidophilum TaxID=76588 RepID=UPI0038CF6BC1